MLSVSKTITVIISFGFVSILETFGSVLQADTAVTHERLIVR